MNENLNIARCITGQSKSGICGAAAYCNKPYLCCAVCDEPCNAECRWLERYGNDGERGDGQ